MASKRCPKSGKFLKQRGMYIDSKGYWCYSAGANRGRRVHRVLTEKELGRPLKRDEVVHHVNGCKTDNRKRNRRVMNERDHNAVSAKQAWFFKNILNKEKEEWDGWFAESPSDSSSSPVPF